MIKFQAKQTKHSPVIFFGLPRPRSDGFFAEWTLQRIGSLILKIALFAHSMLTGQSDGLHP